MLHKRRTRGFVTTPPNSGSSQVRVGLVLTIACAIVGAAIVGAVALYRIVIVRLRHDPRTQAYMRRRTIEGMSKTDIIRCLKRYVAREVHSILKTSAQTAQKTT